MAAAEVQAAWVQWCSGHPMELSPSLLWAHYQAHPRTEVGISAHMVALAAQAGTPQGWLLSPTPWRNGIRGRRSRWLEHAFGLACELGVAALQVIQGERLDDRAARVLGLTDEDVAVAINALAHTPMTARHQWVPPVDPLCLDGSTRSVVLSGEHIDVMANLLAPECMNVAGLSGLAKTGRLSNDDVWRQMLRSDHVHTERRQRDHQQGLRIYDDGAWCAAGAVQADDCIRPWLEAWSDAAIVLWAGEGQAPGAAAATAVLTKRPRRELISQLPWPTDRLR